MNALTSRDVLRPGKKGLARWIEGRVFAAMPYAFAFFRRWKPVVKFGGMTLTSRYDDVKEVFATDPVFGAPYKPKLDVIMGGEPFFLGMADTPLYHRDTDAMRMVVLPKDLPELGRRAEAMAEAIVAAAPGRIEVVDTLVRRVTFSVLADYFGVPEPKGGDLRVWGTRLFEFQFADPKGDPALRADVDQIAPALRAHIDAEIAARKATPGRDDVLTRCLALQKKGVPGFSDVEIRTNLMGFIVGGPPQPPMVVPQAMEQLLRRPAALAGAQAAARAGDDDLLWGYVQEAMRFDPLAPGLPRNVLVDSVIARGTSHETPVQAGDTVLAAFASAMMDPRRVTDPARFDPHRPASNYIHFGYDLHQCFGRHINRATLHFMLKPLLKRVNLRRAPGGAGRLVKNGPFAESLTVVFD
ncbi:MULTISPECIES: cytochrome P450 [unclassified Sphingomonas]|uniref:cytochrome P450 n=1 Tax=unclassified Sphingomonas TaxID=196159 RepID=UPI0022B39C24|nr:cytochrome P450 [Sphingomonas sp. NIBR02145]WHU02576.1 cytochrome P450 [Sphingomonas sp. NIBR02145]